MKKIAIIAPSSLPIPAIKGGAVETLIDHFVAQNELVGKYEVTIFSAFSAEIDYNKLSSITTKWELIYGSLRPVINYYTRFLRRLFKIGFPVPYAKELIKKLDVSNFDLVIVEGNEGFVDLIKKVVPKSKLWLHVHANSFNRYDNKLNGIANSCGKIITVSKFVQDKILKYTSVSSDRVNVLYNCVDTDRLSVKPDYNHINEIKGSLGIPLDNFVVLYVGRIVEDKGIELLVDSFIDINNKKNVTLLIAGSYGNNFGMGNDYKGEFYRRLQTKIEGNDDIIVTGYISNDKIGDIYNVGNLLVVPSLCEDAAPLVLLEGLVCDIPVLATNKGGIPEFVDSKNGRVVTIESFRDAIEQDINMYMNDNDLLKQRNDSMNAVSYYHPSRYFKDFVQLIDSYFGI